MAYAGRVLMLLANHSVPQDIRVWQEAILLTKNGWRVSIICRSDSQGKSEILQGISIYRFPSTPTVYGFTGYAMEFFYSTLMCFILSLKVFLKENFDIIHAHNPPDTLAFIGLFYKILGKKYIFDHHDLSPELYLSRTRKNNKLLYKILLFFEKLSCRVANIVIATNESYRKIEIKRSRVLSNKIYIVRNGPDPGRIYSVNPDNKLRLLNKVIIGYVGAMNPQDGVDYLLRALYHLCYDLKRKDFYCILIGKGDALSYLKRLVLELNISDNIRFTGYIPDEDMRRYLSTADICISPDPSSPLNDVSTWTKIMEYMAMGKPIVAFDLPETRFSAQKAALYAKPNDEFDFAKKIAILMDNPELRKKMGEFGRRRVEKELAWEHVSKPLLQAYNSFKRE